MALEFAEDCRCGVAGELRPAAGLEAVDRLDQTEAGNLKQVVERLVGVRVTQSQVARQRQETLDELIPSRKVAVPVVADQEPSLERPRGNAVVAFGVSGLGQPRRCEGDCTHREPPSIFYLTQGPSRDPFGVPRDVPFITPGHRFDRLRAHRRAFPAAGAALRSHSGDRNDLRYNIDRLVCLAVGSQACLPWMTSRSRSRTRVSASSTAPTSSSPGVRSATLA